MKKAAQNFIFLLLAIGIIALCLYQVKVLTGIVNEHRQVNSARTDLMSLANTTEQMLRMNSYVPVGMEGAIAQQAAVSLIDPWGTPYRMDVSSKKIQWRSSGKDKIWDTADDQSSSTAANMPEPTATPSVNSVK